MDGKRNAHRIVSITEILICTAFWAMGKFISHVTLERLATASNFNTLQLSVNMQYAV
jgi:hypothetical protein